MKKITILFFLLFAIQCYCQSQDSLNVKGYGFNIDYCNLNLQTEDGQNVELLIPDEEYIKELHFSNENQILHIALNSRNAYFVSAAHKIDGKWYQDYKEFSLFKFPVSGIHQLTISNFKIINAESFILQFEFTHFTEGSFSYAQTYFLDRENSKVRSHGRSYGEIWKHRKREPPKIPLYPNNFKL